MILAASGNKKLPILEGCPNTVEKTDGEKKTQKTDGDVHRTEGKAEESGLKKDRIQGSS